MQLPLLLLATALVLLPGCGRPQAATTQDPGSATDDVNGGGAATEAALQETPEAEDQPAVRVRVAPILVDTVRLTIDAVANVESLDVVNVVPERAEPVLSVMVEEGMRVTKGQPLAELRKSLAQLAVDEANVRLAEANNEEARADNDYQRNLALAERSDGTSLLSDRDLDTSKQALATATTAAASAEVALDRAEIDLARCTLLAPIDGTITARDISVGDMTTLGQRAFEITDLDHPRVVFYRPQRELESLRVGQSLTATAEAYPSDTITGTIERIAPVVDAESGTVKVTAILDRSERRAIPTGLLLRLEIELEAREGALLVPKDALILEGGLPRVFVVRGDGVEEVEFEPGFESPTHMQALGEVLRGDDRVVVTGQDRLEADDKIEILEQ